MHQVFCVGANVPLGTELLGGVKGYQFPVGAYGDWRNEMQNDSLDAIIKEGKPSTREMVLEQLEDLLLRRLETLERGMWDQLAPELKRFVTEGIKVDIRALHAAIKFLK